MPWFLTSHEKKALLFVGVLAVCGASVQGWRHWKGTSAREGRAQIQQRIVERDRKLDVLPVKPIFDLNAVGERDLLRIPTVGHVTAARIVQYRRLNGAFKTVGEIDRVPGIGEKRLKEIAPYLYVISPESPLPQAAQPKPTSSKPRSN